MKMRGALGYLAAGLLLAAVPAGAQIEVSSRLEHDRVLMFEPIRVEVTVQNRTGLTLRLGDPEAEDGATLEVDVEAGRGEYLARRDRPLLDEPVTIGPRQVATIRLELRSLFRFRQQGPHTLRVGLRWDDELIPGGRRFFDILPGMELASFRALLADPPGARRTVSLRTLNRERMEFLFLRIDDEREDLCYGVFNLGTVVRVFPPVLRMDAADRIHVLHQSAPARFTHSIIEASGTPVGLTYYNPMGGVRPELREDERGAIEPVGVRPYSGDPIVERPGVLIERRDRP